MDFERRRFLLAAGSAGAAGIAGCAYLASRMGDDTPDGDGETETDPPTPDETGTPPETETETETPEETTPEDPPEGGLVEELDGNPTMPEEGTAENMGYLPARNGDPRHPPLYEGGSVFDEETELIISSVEDMRDEMAEGDFNTKIAFYEPREYLNFAAAYWEKSFDNLTVRVEIPRIGEDAHPEADIVAHWMDIQTFHKGYDFDHGEISRKHQPIAYHDTGVVGESEDPAHVNVDCMIGPEMYKHGLITALGHALGLSYEDSGVMQEELLYNPKKSQDIETMWRDDCRDEVKGIMDTALNGRQLLLREKFDEAIAGAEDGLSRINALPELVNPILRELDAANANYGMLAVYELVYFYDTDLRRVFEHLKSQAENEDPSYKEVDGGDAPVLHAFRHKESSSISVKRSIEASLYEEWTGLDLDLRVAKLFDPADYDYYSSYSGDGDA